MTHSNNENFVARGFRLTKSQLDYIADGSYGFVTKAGKGVYRDLKVIAQERLTGNIIIKESYSGDYSYEKSFILSPEGRTEKLRFPNQSVPIERNIMGFRQEKLQ